MVFTAHKPRLMLMKPTKIGIIIFDMTTLHCSGFHGDSQSKAPWQGAGSPCVFSIAKRARQRVALRPIGHIGTTLALMMSLKIHFVISLVSGSTETGWGLPRRVRRKKVLGSRDYFVESDLDRYPKVSA